jgi:hypothetical protein
MAQIFRFLRVLEYVGTREALDAARQHRSVKGSKEWSKDCKIFEAILGDADQPIIGQLKLWCMQQIVKAAEGNLYPDDDSMRDGYVNAMNDVLRLTLPESEYKKLCGVA